MDINKLFENEEFVKGLLDKTTLEEAQAYFEENGVAVSTQELQSVADTIKKFASGKISQEDLEKAANGELSENELESVAGGDLTVLGVCILVAIGSATGTSVGILSVVEEWRW